MTKAFSLVFVLILCLGVAFAQDHGPTVPPDPGDGGCCTCGYWSCLLGLCQNMPCSISAFKNPMPDSVQNANYTPTLTPLICGKNPTNKASEPITNTTQPQPDIPWLGIGKSEAPPKTATMSYSPLKMVFKVPLMKNLDTCTTPILCDLADCCPPGQ